VFDRQIVKDAATIEPMISFEPTGMSMPIGAKVPLSDNEEMRYQYMDLKPGAVAGSPH
jgi:hypothetical protein